MLLFSSCFCSDFFILVSWNICTISHYFMCILHLLASWTCLIIKYCYIITQTWLKVCFLNHFSPSAWNNEYVLFSRVGLGATVRFPVASRGGSWFKLREQPLRLRGKVAHISNPQSILWWEPRALGSLYSNLCYIFSHRVCFLSICLRFHCLQNCCTISACLSLCIYTCLFLN